MKHLRQRLLNGETLLGCWAVLGSPSTGEILGQSGFDWVLIDMEHGLVDESAALGILQALGATPAGAVVRVLKAEPPIVQRILDMGAEGVMFPRLQNAEEVAGAIAATRYQPSGRRGVARIVRATGYGVHFDEYLQQARDRILNVVQIENQEALAGVDAIAAIDGVDVLFIGPSDLTAALGIFRQFDHPLFRDAVAACAAAARKNGKVAGALLSTPDDISMYCELGYRFLALGSDAGFVAGGAKSALESLKSSLAADKNRG